MLNPFNLYIYIYLYIGHDYVEIHVEKNRKNLTQCGDVGEICIKNSECCGSKICNGVHCIPTPKAQSRSVLDSKSKGKCVAVLGHCEEDKDCCTMNCIDGACDYSNSGSRNTDMRGIRGRGDWESRQCFGVGTSCKVDNECCTDNCNGGSCDY